MLPSRGFFKKNDCPFFEKGLCMRPHCHFRHKKKVVNENSSSADSQEDNLLENLDSIPLLENDKSENSTASVSENEILSIESQHSKTNTDAVENKSNQDSLFAKLVNQTNPYEKINRHIPCAYTPTPQTRSAQPKNKTVSAKNSVNSSISVDLLAKTQHYSSVFNSINSKETSQNKSLGSSNLKNFSLNKLENVIKDNQTLKCQSDFPSSDSNYKISVEIQNEESMYYEPQLTSNSGVVEGDKNENAASDYIPSKVTTAESKYIPNTNDSHIPNDYVPSNNKAEKEKYIPEPTGSITNNINYKPSDKISVGETQYYPEIKSGASNFVNNYVPTQKSFSQASSNISKSENKNILADFEFITSEIEMMKKLLNDDISQKSKEEEAESKTELEKNSKNNETTKESIKKSSKNHKSSSKHRSSSHHSDSSKSSNVKNSSSSSSRHSSHKSSNSGHHHSSSSRHHSSSSKSSTSSRKHKSSSKSHKKSSTSNSNSKSSNSSHSKSHKDSEKSKELNSHNKKKKSHCEAQKKKNDKSVSSDENASDDFYNDCENNSGGESSETELAGNSKKRKSSWSDNDNKAKVLKKSEEILLSDDDDDPDAVEKECLEIFNSYTNSAEINPLKKLNETLVSDQDTESQTQGKKRTAHSTNIMSDHAVLRHKTAKKLHTIKSAQEVMMERYKKVEKAKEISAPAPNLQPTQSVSGLNRPSIRIAAVSNIQQMLQAKKAIEEKISKGLKANERPTIAQSVSHGSQRVAHTPVSKEITEHPTISTGTKQIPRVKRQIYLDKLLLETNQIFPTKSESAEEAVRLEEEVFRANSASFSAYHAAYISLLMKTKRRVAAVKGETTFSNAGRAKVSHSDVLSGGKKNFSVIKTKRVDISMLSDRQIYDELFKCKLSPEELKENGYPVAGGKYGYASCSLNFELKYNNKYLHIKKMSGNRRYCIRCSKQYEVDPVTLKQYKEGPETCSYHPGKKKSGGRNCERVYNCCNSSSTEGCTTHVRHVTDCNNYENLPNCVRTLYKGDEANPGVFALDCEMVYTRLGYELARVTVVNLKKEVVYDTLVKPKYPIECFNTFYSGIEEHMMKGVETTLKDVQAVLLSMFSDKTIIIGHSLDSDLRALHLIHETVVDTAIVYKNEKYHPYKYSLKDLCAKKISKIIQENVGGHDSAEDAIAALEIMLNHVKEEVSKYESLESYEMDNKKK